MTPTRSLLVALVSTTVVVTTALGWAGWRLLDQQRAIDEQRNQDQVDRAADAIAAGIRERLAAAGERLTGWVSNAASPLPTIDDAAVVGVRGADVSVTPAGGLPFLPASVGSSASSRTFAALEAIEFSGNLNGARDGYRGLAAHRQPEVRAGALLRLGRVQRKVKDFDGALATYEQLAALGTVRTDDLPAELAGLTGRRATYIAMSDHARANDVANRILHGLDNGRWMIALGTAELLREPFREARPDSWTLAHALARAWRETDGGLAARGQRVFSEPESASIVVMWRSNGASQAALAAFADRFLGLRPSAAPAVWQLVDSQGRVISGRTTAPPRSRVRIIANPEDPWTLHTWLDADEAAAGRGRTLLLAMLGAMAAFVWGASYFMARAIRREAAVARLQSDFVAAVSHEFRSPLTAVRQVAEMLEDGRLTTDVQRHKYYKMLAAEAGRLQRLVETLLNFGRMEAGAERYRFVDLDASALVREVVDDSATHARESGKAIDVDAGTEPIHVRADHSAIAVALRNLIDNAIKYSPGESTVWVRLRSERQCALFTVIDRGVGIPRSEQRSIFGKFVRGRAAIDAHITGTGVGLAIVQQIVTAHGGEITLESEPGRGSTFTLRLPLAS